MKITKEKLKKLKNKTNETSVEGIKIETKNKNWRRKKQTKEKQKAFKTKETNEKIEKK